MNDTPGPGRTWLAARTGKDPREPAASPAEALATLAQAVREAAGLAARAVSDDAEVRERARAEAADLRRQYAGAPSPAEALGSRLAARLRTAAEELRRE
ncbi:hypothetical protein AB0I00_05905 [Streptomyces sp. NPDC050803]|uniref:hypothetical protein n=1 Tax=unclassified Streptomyces TaxID=2593676 RepID=UPI00342C8574